MKARSLLESDNGRNALQAMCKPENLSPKVAVSLVEAVRSQAGRLRRRGLFDQFDRILSAGEN